MCGLCAAIGWWGVLYPELTMTPDTYKVVLEDETAGQSKEIRKEADFDRDIYRMILEAKEGQIRYKSRLWMQLEAVLGWLK